MRSFCFVISGRFEPPFFIEKNERERGLTNRSSLDIIYIVPRCIEVKMFLEVRMDERLRRIYVPMTETGFYILFCLQTPQHGYGIGQMVAKMTGDAVVISPGTMYGTLSKMEKDGLIAFFAEEQKRKLYCITPLGRELLEMEIRRIERLYQNSKGESVHD